MTPYRLAVLVLSWPIFVTFAMAEPSATQATEFEAKLAEVDHRASKIEGIAADFVQEKRSPLLLNPIRSTGTLRAIASGAVWEAVQPEPIFTRIEGLKLEIYYPRKKALESYEIKGDTAAMTASPLPRLAALQKAFTIEPDAGQDLPPFDGVRTLIAKLTPHDPELMKYVDRVRVVLDQDRGLLLYFEFTDPDGEVTATRFDRIRTDIKIDAASLHLNVPADVTVVRPGEKLR
jgi:outer membrane lipoprotein-sorting protein